MNCLVCIIIIIFAFSSCSTQNLNNGRFIAGYKQKENCYNLLNILLVERKLIKLSDYNLEPDIIAEYEKKLEILAKKYDLPYQIGIGSDGKIKKVSRSYNVRFDRELEDKNLMLYGHPFKKGQKYYIHFSTSTEEKVLKTMSFDDFYKLARKQYFDLNIETSDVIILPSKIKGHRKSISYSPWKPVEFFKNKTKLITFDGRTKIVNNKEIFRHNAATNGDERSILRDFFNNGGQGEIFRSNPVKLHDHTYTGIFIKIDRLPDGHPESIFQDKKMFSLIRELRNNDNVGIIYSTNILGVRGVYASDATTAAKTFSRRKKKVKNKHYLIFAPSAQSDTFTHEMKHYRDYQEDIIKKVIDDFVKLKLEDIIPYGTAILSYIREQRAYSTQAKYLIEQSNTRNGTTKVTISFFEEKVVDYNEYAKIVNKKNSDIFKANYLAPVEKALKELKNEGKDEVLDNLMEILRKFTIKNVFFPLPQV